MSVPPQSLVFQDFFDARPAKAQLVDAFQGKKLSELRTPAFVIDRPVFERNCAKMHAGVKEWDAQFRAHVKTHKTAEGARAQLHSAKGTTHAVVVSTLAEAWGLVRAGLVKDGTVKDILYGLPVGITKLDDLNHLKAELESCGAVLRIMVDHPDQVEALEAYVSRTGSKVWSAFVKIDSGGKRAGLRPESLALRNLVEILLASPAISIYGFYCHAGQAYASTSLDEAAEFLSGEVRTTNHAAGVALSLMAAKPGQTHHQQPFVLSVGSTPTAHAASSPSTLSKLRTLLNGTLEIHAGNYPMNDLQQYATGLIGPTDISCHVLTSVVSYYAGRGGSGSDEAVCDAGALAMSKDRGPVDGFGDVITPGFEGWGLGKVSQEHGVLVRKEFESAPQMLPLGTMLAVVGQHACLTAACFPWYYIVDSESPEGDKVVADVWVPWKAW